MNMKKTLIIIIWIGLFFTGLNSFIASADSAENISPEQAITLAVNNLSATVDGYTLNHPLHTAVFTTDGVRFTPQRSELDWQWALSFAGTNGAPLADVDISSVKPTSNAPDRVVYQRGSVVEQYLAHGQSVEQQFIIPDSLSLNGADLTIAGTVRSAGDFETTEQGWIWSTDGEVVSLGQVTVLDANGRLIPADMHVTADETRITIDGAALAAAAYPVTVDPEIGTNDFRLSDMGNDGNADYDAFDPAIAYSSTENEYLVVWEGNDGVVGDWEVHGQLVDASDGSEIGTDFAISDVSGGDRDAYNPAVTYNSTNNEYLVVWNSDDTVGNDRYEIYGQRLDASNGNSVGVNDFRISDVSGGGLGRDAFNPDVTYSSDENEYLVVWESDDTVGDDRYEIYGQRLDASNGNSVGANDFRISDVYSSGSNRDAYNAAAAYNSQDNEYLVVWEADDLTNNEDWEIFGQRIDASDGSNALNDFRISIIGSAAGSTYGAFNPDVAYNGTDNQYLVVWDADTDVAGVDEEFEIWGQRLLGDGTKVGGTNPFRISDMGANNDPDYDAYHPSVAYNANRSEYLVVWAGDDTTDGDYEIYAQRLNASTGGESLDNDVLLSDMGNDAFANLSYTKGPVVAFSSANNEYLISWYGDDTTLGEFEIYGQRFYQEIIVDGDLVDWIGAEELLGTRDARDYYVTWDDAYIYVAIEGAGGVNDKYMAAIDVDPDDHGSQNGGATDAHKGASWPTDTDYGNKPEYLIESWHDGTSDGIWARQATDGGTDWDAWAPVSSSASRDDNTVEWRFSKSELGISNNDPVGVFIWESNGSDNVYGSWPLENRANDGVFYAYSYLPDTTLSQIAREYVQWRGAEKLSFTGAGAGSASYLNNRVNFFDVNTGGSSCDVIAEVIANGQVTADVNDFQRLVKITRGNGCSSASAKFQIFYEDGTLNNISSELGTGDVEGTLEVYEWGSWINLGASYRDGAANFIERDGFSLPASGTTGMYTLGSDVPTAVSLQSISSSSASPVTLALLGMLLVLVGSTAVLWRKAD